MLTGKRILITGVVTRESIAYAVAERAQALGAEIVLTGFGRGLALTRRVARRLPDPPEVLELDVNEPSHFGPLAARIEAKWGGLDGVLHAIAYAPPDALDGHFLATPAESALVAFRTSAFSFQALTAALEPLLTPHGSVVGLDFDAPVAWPAYDWMGVSKAALRMVTRYLARELGPRRGASTSSPPARCGRWRPAACRCSTRWRMHGRPRPRSAGTPPTVPRWPTRCACCCRTTRAR